MTDMNASSIACTLALCLVPSVASAGDTNWQRYVIPKTGAAVDVPMAIFTDNAALPQDGMGRLFYSNDRRADLTVQSIPNTANDSTAGFLQKQRPPAGIVYKRITPNFFVVSSIRNGRIWYDRCNRSGSYMNCILINYPAAEKRQWDGIVTRISYSLAD